jgi:hypothetical protein
MKPSIEKIITTLLQALFMVIFLLSLSYADPIIIDHTCTDLSKIPSEWIDAVKNNSFMYYAHTSHGEQLTTGLDRIKSTDPFYNIAREYWRLPDEGNTFNIYEPSIYDNWDYTDLVPDILTNYPTINYSMYCWCSQMTEYTSEQVQDYLDRMAALETTYPNVTFIYMTGNAQNTDIGGYNRYIHNEQIRDWVRNVENRVLFDFADLDSWWYNSTTGVWEQATYEYNGGIIPMEHPQFNGDEAGHTTFKSCEQKGKAVWWMMARLAGWNSVTTTTTSTAPITTTTIDLNTTTTIKADNCLAEEIYGKYSEEAELLRYLRDNLLNKTPVGKEIIKLYYQWSPLIVKAIDEDEEFKKEVESIIDEILLLIKRMHNLNKIKRQNFPKGS